ncbi:TPA: hypothetical protein HA265_05790 [Candidatus Woesearchaeota archaeon]|nr:hypothetical protein [Candidatus Woesearchaeota archaeon]
MEKEAANSGFNETVSSKKAFSESKILIPTTIFCDRSLSFSEALVEYLKDQKQLSYHEIAVLTNRDERNIWTLYNRAGKKRTQKEPAVRKAPTAHIPLEVVTDRSLSILEIVVEYLRDKAQLKNSQIAAILNRSRKTVSTVYIRTKKKRSASANEE